MLYGKLQESIDIMSNESNIYDKDQVDAWINGVSYEVAFWNGYLTNKKNLAAVLDKTARQRELSLPFFDPSEFEGEKPVILDVGCGMVYANGTLINGAKTDYHYVDPLASSYNSIIEKKKISLPKIEFGMIEYLSGYFDKNSVSLVIVQNALDHCFDPVKGIAESMEILKQGGVLYLMHRRNEAEFENYRGFHQYNIDCENGQLICWNKKKRVNINEYFRRCADVEVHENNGHIYAVIRKNAEFDIECFYPPTDDKRRLSTQVMYVISKLMEHNFILTYYSRYSIQRFLHFWSAKVTQDFKTKLKNII